MEEYLYAPHPPTVAAGFAEYIRGLVEHLIASKVPFGEAPHSEAVKRARDMIIVMGGPLPNGFTLNVDPKDLHARIAVHLLQNGSEAWEPELDYNNQRQYPKTLSGEKQAIYDKQISIRIRCHNAIGESLNDILCGWSNESINALGECIRKYWLLAFAQKFPSLLPTPAPVVVKGKGKRGRKRLAEANPAKLIAYTLIHAAVESFVDTGPSHKGRRARRLKHLTEAPEHRQLRDAVAEAESGLELSSELIDTACKIMRRISSC